mmetsp:Transcript_32790/g.40557  ORF Transcript_32790/g.40557 Transcript_32790/m.40557 type:complete len:151 (-) Transcript_32790:645-1097(-)|eukprot:CAMPEP_0170460180 /NCGR_PEP_ID=MMETSP0123-20130129/6638_1 /TAXON_ID=182087 /ORGANISM="Favella ehrenbergii, Strain Fehren 1" /LENGTH=150 /DNA_ID=CAMNT_0010725047 /DNA_START=236 /DNA_END=688 /DNA_ORIENTATION=-
MTNFAKLCLTMGKGHLKAIVKANATSKDLIMTAKSFKSANKSSKSGGSKKSKKRSNVGASLESGNENEPKPAELYFEDLLNPVCKTLIGSKARNYVPGELRNTLSDNIMVELVGFIAHILKIAVIWSWNNEQGVKSLQKTLTKLIKEDIP